MKKQHIIVNLVVSVVLLAQINLPLFIHVCTMMNTVTILATCGMHEAEPREKSCCEATDDDGEDQPTGHCEEIFAKEASTDGTINDRVTEQNGCTHVVGVISCDATPIVRRDARTFPTDSSPPESPPLYLLDSVFRI